MAETHSALEQLADISEPTLQLGFELAPAWWFLITLAVTGLLGLVWFFYRRWRYFAAKRHALTLLSQLASQNQAASEINQLLKRVLQHYQPHHPALSMNTEQWQRWLAAQQQLPLPDLTALLYQAGHNAQACEQFYQFAKTWLSRYRGEAPLSPAAASEECNA